MYEHFYHLKEKPFALSPDPGFLFLSEQHKGTLTHLEYGVANQAEFTVITGDIGTGKTTLIRHLLDQLDDIVTVGLITNTHRSFGDALGWILLAFGLEHTGKNKTDLYQTLVDFLFNEYACNRRTVLVVDEAQNLETQTLEELRMLSTLNTDKDLVLQIILVGQPQLRDMLRQPGMAQLLQRIASYSHLEPLDELTTQAYIRHRLSVAGGDPELFEPDACRALYRYSGGVPRLINLLCDIALVYGFGVHSPRITAALIIEVARDKQAGGILPLHEQAPEVASPEHSPGQHFMQAYDEAKATESGTDSVPNEDVSSTAPPIAQMLEPTARPAKNGTIFTDNSHDEVRMRRQLELEEVESRHEIYSKKMAWFWVVAAVVFMGIFWLSWLQIGKIVASALPINTGSWRAEPETAAILAGQSGKRTVKPELTENTSEFGASPIAIDTITQESAPEAEQVKAGSLYATLATESSAEADSPATGQPLQALESEPVAARNTLADSVSPGDKPIGIAASSPPPEPSEEPVTLTAASTMEASFTPYQEWIEAQDPNQFTIHMVSTRSRENAQAYIRQYGLEDHGAYYVGEKAGVFWYSVIYGVYPSLSAARKMVKSFPHEIQAGNPWIRNIRDIQKYMVRP
jgi:type II secretory pathway predicted ATPase ExeA